MSIRRDFVFNSIQVVVGSDYSICILVYGDYPLALLFLLKLLLCATTRSQVTLDLNFSESMRTIDHRCVGLGLVQTELSKDQHHLCTYSLGFTGLHARLCIRDKDSVHYECQFSPISNLYLELCISKLNICTPMQ